MDIQVASNFERALFEASNRDAEWTGAAMATFARDRSLVLPPQILSSLRARYSAAASSDEQTIAAIKAVHAETGRIIDPHTAVGVAAARLLPATGNAPTVILSTAHPAKFPEAVARAIGHAPPQPSRLQGLEKLPERVATIPAKLSLIQDFISSRLAP
jgi:threonine synthase